MLSSPCGSPITYMYTGVFNGLPHFSWGSGNFSFFFFLFLFFSYLLKKYYWSIVDLQCCMYIYAAKSLQLCPILCDPVDGSPPASPVPGILQARTLEWVAISFSNAWQWKVKVKSLSRVRLLATPWTAAHQGPPSMGFFRQEYWSGVPLPSLVCVYIYIYIFPFILYSVMVYYKTLNTVPCCIL